MGLETWNPSSLPSDLNVTWPLADDPLNKGDDHIRLLKTVVNNFWNTVYNTSTSKLKVGVIPPAVNSNTEGSGFGGFRYQVVDDGSGKLTLRLFTT